MSLGQILKKISLVFCLSLFLLVANTNQARIELLNPAHGVIAATGLSNQVKGSLQQAGGKVQESVGNLTGDRETQIEGKVKQAEGDIRTTPSDPGGHPTADNPEAVVVGKTQQAESNIRRFQARDPDKTDLRNTFQ